MDATTRGYARGLDSARKSLLGKDATLVLLNLTTRDESGVGTYDAALVVPDGWNAERVKGRDGAIYTRLEIADLRGDVAAVMAGESKPTDFALSGVVFRIEPKETVYPLQVPKVWEFRARVETGDTYP